MEKFENNFDEIKNNAKKFVVGAAMLAGVEGAAAQQPSHERDDLQHSHEHTVSVHESSSHLREHIENYERDWEHAAQGKHGEFDPHSFTVVSRSEIEKTFNPFDALGDRFITNDIAVDLRDTGYALIARDGASLNALNNEANLAENDYSLGSHYHYIKPAYYFVVEERPEAKGEFALTLVTPEGTVENLASVDVPSSLQGKDREAYFNDTLIPSFRDKISAKAHELGLAGGR